MKTETADVKIEGAVVGQAKVTVYETMTEVIKDLTETETLKLINAKIRQEAMNKRREELREESLAKKMEKLARKDAGFKKELEALQAKYEAKNK